MTKVGLFACAEAKAFALLQEEGIAKGIRRIVAVTGAEAEAAIAEAGHLSERLAAGGKLSGEDLENEVKALQQVSYGPVMFEKRLQPGSRVCPGQLQLVHETTRTPANRYMTLVAGKVLHLITIRASIDAPRC